MTFKKLTPTEFDFCKQHVYRGSAADKTYQNLLANLLLDYQGSGTSGHCYDYSAVERFADTLRTKLEFFVSSESQGLISCSAQAEDWMVLL